ncbi:MAG TPA: hypothetical protein VHC21_00885 [Candidatus Saccharimonadales bacterium]|nr:hypothetical protein [Candidatus Saccharimonadales bacterium]
MPEGNTPPAGQASRLYTKTKHIVGSKLFFKATLALFVLQAGYIAIKSGFPLAFDESYHLGITQLYAQQWSPFFSHLPNSTGQYGALATDPSYLYHYLLSFPYRLISAVTQNTFTVIVFLRFINILLFVGGLVAFKRVLRYTRASNALINLTLLIFTLLPLESFTAAQINYDNLLFPVMGVALLLCLRFIEKLRQHNVFDVTTLALLVATCLLGAQVKFVFVPICLTILGLVTLFTARWVLQNKQRARKSLQAGLAALSGPAKLSLLSLVVVSAGLFGWRFGYNEVAYGSPMPDCAKVMGVAPCMQYAPWARNYQLEHSHVPVANLAQTKAFARAWTKISGTQLFTVLDGNEGGATVNPDGRLIAGAALVVGVGGVLLTLQWRKIKHAGYATVIILTVSAVYLACLVLKNYSDFITYGMPIAIQGRYLLPVLLIFMVLGARVYSEALKHRPQLKVAVLAAVVVIGLQGGGLITYVTKTNSSWRWSSSAALSLESTHNTPVIAQKVSLSSQSPKSP